MKISSKPAWLGALAVALSACGGSSTETPTPNNASLSPVAPVAPVQPAQPPQPPQPAQPTEPTQPAQQPASAYQSLIQQIYIVFYGRPTDPIGLIFWSQQFSTAYMPLTLTSVASSYATNAAVRQMVDAFADSVEAREVASGTSAAAVNVVYLNAFNRTAEPSGNEYWSALVGEGKLTRAQMALLIWSGAQGSDAIVAAKKTQAALAVTGELDTPAESTAYSGDAVLQGARDLLSAITDATDMAAYQAQIDGYVASLPSAPGHSATIAHYVGFSTQQRPTGTPSYSAQYTYAGGGVVPPGTAGTLVYGLNQLTIGWTRGALNRFDYDATFNASSSIQGKALMPAVTMLCRPLTPQSNVLKSTDVLVARSARQLGVASQLAGQTLSTYRQDCAVSSGTQSISFDSAGNATFTSAAGVSQIDAATVSAGLNGKLLHDVANNLDFYFFAYSYVRANGSSGIALVQRISVPATTGILPGESVVVWSQE